MTDHPLLTATWCAHAPTGGIEAFVLWTTDTDAGVPELAELAADIGAPPGPDDPVATLAVRATVRAGHARMWWTESGTQLGEAFPVDPAWVDAARATARVVLVVCLAPAPPEARSDGPTTDAAAAALDAWLEDHVADCRLMFVSVVQIH